MRNPRGTHTNKVIQKGPDHIMTDMEFVWESVSETKEEIYKGLHHSSS